MVVKAVTWILVVDEGLRTLMDFRFNRHFKSPARRNGMSKGMHGRGSDDTYVKVPQGTTVRDAENRSTFRRFDRRWPDFSSGKRWSRRSRKYPVCFQETPHRKLLKMANPVKNVKSN